MQRTSGNPTIESSWTNFLWRPLLKQKMPQLAGNDRAKQPELSKTHISETPLTFANWYIHINWENVFWVIGLPIIGLIAANIHPIADEDRHLGSGLITSQLV